MTDPSRAALPGPDEVHVWWIDLERIAHAPAALTPQERQRAERFRHPRDGARWAAARAALRQILGRYLGIAPRELELTRGAWGKPALAGAAMPRFSLSHAGERAALVVAAGREVGIDLEPLDPDLDLGPLLAVACTPAEAARLEALPGGERVAAFLACWTLKEAYLTGTGAGLCRDPRDIEIECEIPPRPGGRAIVRDPVVAAPWALRLLDPGPGWVAALAAAGAEPTPREERWPPERRTWPAGADNAVEMGRPDRPPGNDSC